MMNENLKRTFDWFATALVVVAAGLFIWTQVEARRLRERPAPQIQDARGLTIKPSALRYVKGHGPIALVEFTDYECPACGEYARQTAPAVDKQLVSSGGVQHVVFNYPLEQIHPRARPAAEAAECAARQGRYWEMHTRLFTDRSSLDAERIAESAKVLGLDEARFAECLSGEATDAVTKDVGDGMRLGVRGTPTFFIGLVQADGSIVLVKRLTGAISFDGIKGVVEEVRHVVKPS